MYKIVPAERQGRSKGTITKNRCKPSKNGLQRSFLAPPARLELTTFRLGGGPSILVRYGGIYTNYLVIQGSGIRTVRLLGGGRSIQLSYQGKSHPAAIRRRIPDNCTPTHGVCQRRRGILPPILADFLGKEVAPGIFVRYNKWSSMQSDKRIGAGAAAKSA